MPEATRAVFVMLICKGHRVWLDQQRPDLTAAQKDVDSALFTASLTEAIEALALPGARASDSDDARLAGDAALSRDRTRKERHGQFQPTHFARGWRGNTKAPGQFPSAVAVVVSAIE
jgi:hypothetical protein